MSELNGSSGHQVPLRAGVYAPIVTIFKQDGSEDLDLAAQEKHTIRLAQAGLAGLVILGSNGEAVHLTRDERIELVKATRSALDGAQFPNYPVIVGCTAQSVRETIQLAKEAAGAGATHALILPPCYYKPAMTDAVIEDYFKAVADKSPIPILMYNYPGAVAGVDMSSDLMTRISSHPNVVGAKFTCANTGKLTRLSAATNAINHAGYNSGFLTAGGFADMEVQTYVSNGSGVIVGTANVVPRLCVQVWELATVKGDLAQAMRLQQDLAAADWVIASTGISGTKSAMTSFLGYGGVARRPLPVLNQQQQDDVKQRLTPAWEIEKSLQR